MTDKESSLGRQAEGVRWEVIVRIRAESRKCIRSVRRIFDSILAELMCSQNEDMTRLSTSIRVSWQLDEGNLTRAPQIDRFEHEESLGVTHNTPVSSL